MGLIDTMVMSGTFSDAIMQIPAEGLWAMVLIALSVSTVGILLNVSTRPRRRPLHLVSQSAFE
ncbi:MAG: hypothetical protein HY270_20120 [Deltaproteobacteria bacterium]|nr:hypothetical protein [Deltaproteobacteria bacterium]